MSKPPRDPKPGQVWAMRRGGDYCVVRRIEGETVITSNPGVLGGLGVDFRWPSAGWHTLFRYIRSKA